MESQTSVSKQAPRELQNWRVQGNPLTLRQPFANPVPTLCQQGVFAEKGAHVHGKWGSAPPPPPKFPIHRLAPPPLLEDPLPLGFSVKPPPPPGERGAGARGRRGPIYRENEPPFRRKRLQPFANPLPSFSANPSPTPFFPWTPGTRF